MTKEEILIKVRDLLIFGKISRTDYAGIIALSDEDLQTWATDNSELLGELDAMFDSETGLPK